MVLKRLKLGIQRETPLILTGLGIMGFVTSTVLAVRVTPHAQDALYRARSEREDSDEEVHELFENFKTVAPIYAPSFALSLLSASLVLGGVHIQGRRLTALSTAYALSQQRLSDLRDSVTKVVSEKVKDEIIATAGDTAASREETPEVSEGYTLFFDTISGRYFEMPTVESFRKVVNDLNSAMFTASGSVSINELFYEIGLPEVLHGSSIFWTIESGSLDPKFTPSFTPEGDPYVIVEWYIEPQHFLSNGGNISL